MIGNLSKVQERLRTYVVVPDKRFTVKSGLTAPEEGVKQKVRQYWGDNDIANVKKLQGVNIDLRGFDPRRTTSKELHSVTTILSELGIIDDDLVNTIADIDREFNNAGKEINRDKEIDVYACFERNLASLEKHVARGDEYAKSAFVDLKAAIAVVMALEEAGKTPRTRSLVSIRA
jgi:hypothetical protein